MTNHKLLQGLLLLALCGAAFVEPAEAVFPGGRKWAAGLGVFTSPNPFIDHGTEIAPIPLILYSGDRFQALGTGLQYSLIRSPRLQFGMQSNFRFEGFDPEKGSHLAGMERRNGAFEVGARASWFLSPSIGEFAIQAMTDASGVHDGHEVSFGLQRPFGTMRWSIAPSVSAKWKSAELVDYYYGVRASEATDDRTSYAGEAAWNWGAGVEFNYFMSWDWLLTGGTDYQRLSSEIRDSPIVEDGHAFSQSVAVLYLF